MDVIRRSNVVAAMACLILLTACGGGSKDPESTVAPTESANQSLPPGAVTVGDLITRMDAAWAGVQSWRVTTWSTEGEITNTPPVQGQVTIEDVVLPSSRQVTMIANGQTTDVQIAVDGRIYAKGRLVPAAVAPMVDVNTWVEVNPETANSSSPIAPQIAYLISPIASPFTGALADTRSLQATQGATFDLDGRTCTNWTFGRDAGISYELAIDQNDLPCRLVESAGGFANVSTYTFNMPDAIIATPVVTTPPS